MLGQQKKIPNHKSRLTIRWLGVRDTVIANFALAEGGGGLDDSRPLPTLTFIGLYII